MESTAAKEPRRVGGRAGHRRVPGAAAAWLLAALALVGAVRADAQSSSEPLRIVQITPAGTDVAAGREIVLEFDRPMVPLGRMGRTSAEIPITIEPALDCEWRWLDTRVLACRLSEAAALTPATRYTLTIAPGLTAIDGAALAEPVRHEFVTERPRVSFAAFDTWRAPGVPVIRVFFTQPVAAFSAEAHLFLVAAERRYALRASPDPHDPNAATPDGARRVWLLEPEEELPADAAVQLRVEPGLVPSQGTEPGVESRVVVAFHTFPAFRFVGVTCRTLTGAEIVVTAQNASAARACNPLAPVGLSFSSPVIASEVRDGVALVPDLAAGRADYDPWANVHDYSMLGQPHARGRRYTVWLPERLAAARSYRLQSAGAGPADEFGRRLAAPIDLEFFTDHRPPNATLAHPQAVLEQGVDSEVPLYVTNLDEVTLRYRRLTAGGRETDLVRTIAVPDIEDLQFPIALGVRELLDGGSGVVHATISTQPPLPGPRGQQALFAEVTPYQVHVKLGHYNTLVWVTDLATGRPVADAEVVVYVDRLAELAPDHEPLAAARTDAFGVALLAGTETLDPALERLGYGCPDARHPDDCPRLFVRVDGEQGFALLPLDYRFEVSAGRASRYTVWPQSARKLGHLLAWGTTAQGVYRAGETIHYKLYVRDQSNETLVPAPRGPYRLEIVDPTGRVVHTVDVELSDFGSFSGRYELPQNATVGWYQFVLHAPTNASADAAPDEASITRTAMQALVSDFTPAAFGVTAALNGDLFRAGEEVEATGRATLFSGGPYTDAETRITARIDAAPFETSHPLASGFVFSSYDRPRSVPLGEHVGRVDGNGEVRQSFRIPEDIGREIVAGVLRAEAAVRDDRGRYVASRASARFVAVDRLVGLRSTRWVHRQGEPAELEYLVVDAAGAPAPGTEVAIEIERLETRAARVRGAGNAYLTQFVEEWVPAGACAGTSAATPSTCAFVPDAPGSYRLRAMVQDSAGRPHATTLHTWVVGAGHVVWSGENDDGLEIVPESDTYAIGDRARYLVKNPYPGALALVTVERYGVLERWVQTLEGSTPVIELEIKKDFMPGFYLSVLVMSPRVEAPPPEPGEVDLGKPAFKIGYLAVPVEDPYKKLDVEVRPDAEVCRPGDTVRVAIRARPRERERREPIEVAVAVLDEAVLDLIQGGTSYFDPYAGFYRLEPLDVHNFGLLTRLVGRQKIELKGANPAGDGGASLAMRSVFELVSYWNPSLVLDARGRGEIEFRLPDNLTGWRVLVMAATPTDRLGLGTASLRVNRPTEIRPAMPNQVSEGDRFTAAFTVMNRTDAPRDLRVAIAASGNIASPVTQEAVVHLEPYERTTVTTAIEAGLVAVDPDLAAGRIRFEVTAGDRRDTDGLVHELPVRKRRVVETAASYGSLDGGAATEPLRFPADLVPDAGAVGAVLSPTVLGNLEGAFRYLRDYPYAGWEQELTRGVMASLYLRLRGYLPADLEWPGGEAVPQAVLDRAASHQAPGGGMTYYVPDDAYASPYLSAYTALAFAWLRADGHAVPEAVEAKLHEYLDAFLKRDVLPDFYSRGMASTVRAVALAALAKRGRIGLADVMRYRPHVAEMSLFGKAHYLEAALAVEGGEALAREVAEIILGDSSRTAGELAFNERLTADYRRILVTPLAGNCAVLGAFAASGFGGDAATALARAVTRARGARDHWESTHENVFCTRALAEYAARFEAEPPSMEASVAIGGEPLGTAAFTSVRDAPATITRPIRAADAGTAAELAIVHSGTGRLYYSARMTYASPSAARDAVDAGLEVRREYSVRRDGEWRLLEDRDAVRRGELVRVDLFVSLPTARHFVVVDDPVPGGLEPVNRDLANASVFDAEAGDYEAAGGSWWHTRDDWRAFGFSRWSFYHRELRHDAARFYSEYLPPGNYHLSYTAQAVAAGEFDAPPTHAEEMYDPDVFGRGAARALRVEER
ncbi:MAG TPA: MG2 domain-containing protein [Gammaproteobacteria bacterium]